MSAASHSRHMSNALDSIGLMTLLLVLGILCVVTVMLCLVAIFMRR
jgi:heme/copper-type cytochrome/quinol oxidase subunit 2